VLVHTAALRGGLYFIFCLGADWTIRSTGRPKTPGRELNPHQTRGPRVVQIVRNQWIRLRVVTGSLRIGSARYERRRAVRGLRRAGES